MRSGWFDRRIAVSGKSYFVASEEATNERVALPWQNDMQRSDIMRRVRSRDTIPELRLRRALHSAGYRFRVNLSSLPGRPDIVLTRRRKVLLVHGCFWHGHPGCSRGRIPKTNVEFWTKKVGTNVTRDQRVEAALVAIGYDVMVVWQCELRDLAAALGRVRRFFGEPNWKRESASSHSSAERAG